MAYALQEIVLGNDKMSDDDFARLWSDIASGKIPLIIDSNGNRLSDLLPITRYDECGPEGAGRVSILALPRDFIEKLEHDTARGLFVKFEATDENSPGEAAKRVWREVEAALMSGELPASHDGHFEMSLPPQLAEDGKAHACVYMNVNR